MSLSTGGQDFVKAIEEIGKLSARLEPGATNDFVRSSRTGFLWSNRNVSDIEGYRHHQQGSR